MLNVIRYSPSCKERWDAFVRNAKNGHFIFLRDYMDYHADRFIDHSLLIEKKGKLIAVLPGHIDGEILTSHGGLTYGGILSGKDMKTGLMLDVFDRLIEYLGQQNVNRIVYKAIPYIYHTIPSDESLYALHIRGAQLVRRDLSTVIDYRLRLPYSKGTKYNISKARRNNLACNQNYNLSEYWNLLTQVLRTIHDRSPVHTLEEITALARKFPDNIQLFETRDEQGDLLAGALLYIYRNVVHTQYLANSETGRQVGALDYLLDRLIEQFSSYRYFSFGISTTNEGKTLNRGLIQQKEGFGGRCVVHDFYTLQIR